MDIMIVSFLMQHKPTNIFVLSFMQDDDHYKNWEITWVAHTEVSLSHLLSYIPRMSKRISCGTADGKYVINMYRQSESTESEMMATRKEAQIHVIDDTELR